tara:strand:- start:466 stop:1125 length:660 start_codon:yes stop_codon:yes gene_type:complete
MQKKVMIFDFDGVIVDSEPVRYQTYKELFQKEFGVFLPKKDLTIYGRTPRMNIMYFLEKYSLKGDVDALLMKRNRLIYDAFNKEENIIPIEGVVNFIRCLKSVGIRMAIASSGHQDHITKILDHLNLREYFEVIVSGDMVQNGKPHPEIFIKTAERLGEKPENCIVIEDSVNGFIAAKAASMKVIGLNHTFPDGTEHLVDKTITDFKDLDEFQIKIWNT